MGGVKNTDYAWDRPSQKALENGRGGPTPSTVLPTELTAMNDRSPQTKDATESSKESESTDTSRRAFLGAAAALSALPAFGGTATATDEETDDSGSQPRVEVSHGDHGENGPSHASVESGDSIRGFLSLGELDDDESSFSVNGYHYEDEPGDVEIYSNIGCVSITYNCTPERALELAEELTLAAEHAWGDV